jgi:hypothetical protein
VAAIVRFRRSALDDIARYEAWREGQDRHWAPIAYALLDAIVQAAGRFDSFDQIPAPRLALNGEVAQVKRLLVPVRSKVFRVYVGRGRRADEISVRRVQHPSQEPLEY